MMQFIEANAMTADTAWAAHDIAEIDGATVRLHWTDAPYVWHVNDGPEVFVVLDGIVDMHYRRGGEVHIETLHPGRICFAEDGDEHVAVPHGQARILVIERRGSI